MNQIFRHLDPDESATDHNGRLWLSTIHKSLDPISVRNAPQAENIFQVNALKLRSDRLRARGQDQFII
jgi:hypothetical protein